MAAIDQPGGIYWKEDLFSQIRERNRLQRDTFRPIFEEYRKILSESQSLTTRNIVLETQLRQSTAIPGGVDPVKVKEYEAKIEQLKEEVNISYKHRAENAGAIVQLNRQKEELERQLLAKEKELATKASELSDLKENYDRERGKLQPMENTINMLSREAESLRSALNAADERIRGLVSENKQLLDRILDMKNQQAQQINSQNELHDKIMKDALLAAERQLKDKLSALGIQDEKAASAVSEVDRSEILDSVAWQSNFNVSIATGAKQCVPVCEGQVTCARYNATGTLVVAAAADTQVYIFDARTSQQKSTLHGMTQCVVSAAFSPDDSYVIASGNEFSARVWSAKTSRVLHTLTGHTAKIYASLFSSDNSKAITGSHDRTIKVFDMTNGYCRQSIIANSSINYLSLSPNGDLLASAHYDKTLRFWSLRTGEIMHATDELHTQIATCVEFSRDGVQVVSNSKDGTLKILDVRTWHVVKTLKDDKGEFKNGINWGRAVFSPDSQYVAAGSANGSLYIWDVQTGKIKSILPNKLLPPRRNPVRPTGGQEEMIDAKAVTSVAWNRNGRQLVSSDNWGCLTFWEGTQ